MNIEFSTVGPDASLKQVQDLIIKNRMRILPVVEGSRVIGVITRTDLLNILVGGPVIPDFLYDAGHASQFIRKKNMTAMLKERLPKRIIDIFKEFGITADRFGYNVYLVGGLVRDILLKRENLDVDIVIEGDGINFAHEFAKQHGARVRSHRKFGTAVLIFPDGFKVDVATARMEYYESPAAPPIVETSSLKMDLFRRDFTMNTLAIKLNKQHYGILVDYFGAQKDIKERCIRVLHNLSFVEDPTRVLRAIRFEQRFGFKIGKLTLSLMKNAVTINCFEELSGRRLFLEMKLLLMEQEPIRAIERMSEFDLLPVISPKILLTRSLVVLLHEIRGAVSWFSLLFLEEAYEPWKVYWHGLTSTLGVRALGQLAKRLQLGEKETQALITQRKDVNSVLDKLFRMNEPDHSALYTLLSQYDTELLLFMLATANSEKIKRLISTYFTKLKGTKTLLKGGDLKAMGFQPGPLYREILNTLLEARLNGSVGTRKDEVNFVKKHFKEQSGVKPPG
jgi:tRNA nucleotidyltransferase (CCA-adding enzyme)